MFFLKHSLDNLHCRQILYQLSYQESSLLRLIFFFFSKVTSLFCICKIQTKKFYGLVWNYNQYLILDSTRKYLPKMKKSIWKKRVLMPFTLLLKMVTDVHHYLEIFAFCYRQQVAYFPISGNKPKLFVCYLWLSCLDKSKIRQGTR